MKKKQYIQPEVAVSLLETSQMMASSLGRFEDSADARLDVLVNENSFTDIWGN